MQKLRTRRQITRCCAARGGSGTQEEPGAAAQGAEGGAGDALWEGRAALLALAVAQQAGGEEGGARAGAGGAGGPAALRAVAGAGAVWPALLLPALADAGIGYDVLRFNPVCPASDGIFRVGQQVATNIAGDANIENYRPLINDVLIRVRTELCILESFVRETALPFIGEKGVGWILPLRESSETYLAGVVFMVGANFILLGSTKVVAILSIYHDIALGLPSRLLGRVLSLAGSEEQQAKLEASMEKLMDEQMAAVKAAMKQEGDREKREAKVASINADFSARIESLREKTDSDSKEWAESPLGKAANAAGAVAVPLNVYGRTSLVVKQVLEVFDTFCSRYFVAFTVGYILIKTAHFVLFPDFPCSVLGC